MTFSCQKLHFSAQNDIFQFKKLHFPAENKDAMATLAQESFDILTLLPTYIENTKDAIAALANDTKVTKMGAGVNVFDK
jgi:hypothetical protein